MAIPVRYSFQSLRARRVSMVAAAVGIAMVVFVLATSRMLAEGIRTTLRSAGKPERDHYSHQHPPAHAANVAE